METNITDNIVAQIQEYVNHIHKEYVNHIHKNSYVFGNTAFPDSDGNINIGSGVTVSDDYKDKQILVDTINDKFRESLNKGSSYSITRYVRDKQIKCFSLEFSFPENQGKNRIIIIPHFIPYNNDANESPFYIEQEESSEIDKISWTEDRRYRLQEADEGKFCSTINFYRKFCLAVKDKLEKGKGFIYLIRPNNQDAAFDGLTYMFVKEKLGSKDIDIISLMLSSYYLEKFKNEAIKQKDEAIKQSIRAAKAAIMSRNMSHNLGSHVMAYLKQDLSSVEEIIRNGVLEKLKDKEEVLEPNSTLEMPFLVGLGRFISYLQERQDFIATVCTDYIPYPSPVNFKDFIYDELNADYRSKRHSERSGIAPSNILLQNIVKSEGLTRNYLWTEEGKINEIHSDIFISFRNFYGDDAGSEDLKDLRKINVSLPGGVMGRQAFFSIMENIIRNAAKHGKWQEKQYLNLVIDIYETRKIDDKTTFYRVAEDDERRNIKDEKFLEYLNTYYSSIDDDLYIVSITDNTNSSQDDVDKITRGIEERYVEDNGNILKESNKGIKEMRISAAWLRGVQEDNIQSPVLKVRLSKDANSNSDIQNLQYLFCLPKLCKVAVVCPDSQKDQVNIKKNLFNQHDWGIFTVSDFKNTTNRSYEFIVLENEAVHEELRAYCHQRTCINPEMVINATEKEKPFDFYEREKELFDWLAGDAKNATIAIFDNIKNENVSFDKIKSFETQKEKDNMSIPFVYRRHHDTRAEFNSFMKMRNGNLPRFVESISGGNSTDRLIRNSILDYRWFCTHIHAMTTRVAVFDERLFSKITKLEEKDLLFAVDWDNKWKEESNISKMQGDLYSYDVNNKNYCGIEDNSNQLFGETADHDKILALAKKWYPFPSESIDYMPIVFNQKGISLFTIVSNGDDGFAVWGCTDEILEDINNYDDLEKRNDRCAVKKIANIVLLKGQKNNSPIKIEFVSNYDEQFEQQFDYVSIHQGLLDKIYNKLEVEKRDEEEKKEIDEEKTKEREKDIEDDKKKVTSTIYNSFVKTTDKDEYLPGLFIHSGRSKPNEKDMPQHQPFLQYSAIEHAIMDCKFELVQLLDFAKF